LGLLPAVVENDHVKVLLLTPSPVEKHPGFTNTVMRYRDGLQRRGHLAELFGVTTDGDLRESLTGKIGRFKPDIVHAHDAFHMGMQLLGLRVPWVVSMSGEDFHRDMRDRPEGPLVCEVFRRANRTLVATKGAVAMMEETIPDTVGKVDVVPRAAVKLPTQGTDLRRALGIPKNRFLILLAGGIRPVKGQMRAVSLVPTMRKCGLQAEMIIVGTEQDKGYCAQLAAAVEGVEGVRILPALSAERMGAAYLDADVVLNTSLSEAASPTILEAGILGRPVVASRVPGNVELIRHKETGLLYDDEQSLAKTVIALAQNRSAAGALGVRLREDFERRFKPENEIDQLLAAYAAA
jgi:glycosyltransferase involved in cell wall biosynthesis